MPTDSGTPRITLPRGLIVLSCLWIAISWVTLFGVRPPVQAVASSYADGVTMLSISVLLGITLGWPLLRTSGRVFQLPMRETLLDMLVLACGVQVTIWPLRLISTWSSGQTLVISLQLTAWIVITGALVRFGAGTRSAGRRAVAMLLTTLLLLAGLLLDTDSSPEPPWWSSLGVLRELAGSPRGAPITEGLLDTATLAVAGLGAWFVLAGVARLLPTVAADQPSD